MIRPPVLVLSRRSEATVGPQNLEIAGAIAARGVRVASHFGDVRGQPDTLITPHPGMEIVQAPSWTARLTQRAGLALTLEYLARTAAFILRARPGRIIAVCEYPLAAALLAGFPLDRLAYYPLELPDRGSGMFNIPHNVVRRFAPRLRWVLVPGEHRGEVFRREYGVRRFFVAYNSLSKARRAAIRNPDLLADDVRARLPDEPFVLYQGSMYDEYCADLLLDAFAIISRRWPVVAVGHVIGEARKRRVRELERAGGFLHLGLLPNHSLHGLRRLAALGICTQDPGAGALRWACTPNKYFDYVSSGLPVVCSPNPPLRLWNRRYGTGVCAEPLKVDTLAACVEELMADDARRAAMSRRCLEEFDTRLNFEAQVAPFLDAFLGGTRGEA